MRPTSSVTGSLIRMPTTGWPGVIDSITCAGSKSFEDSVRIQKQADDYGDHFRPQPRHANPAGMGFALRRERLGLDNCSIPGSRSSSPRAGTMFIVNPADDANDRTRIAGG